MSKIVVLSDLHGNYPALNAVTEAEGTEAEYFVLGDVHGLGSWASGVTVVLRQLDAVVLAGNHDKAIFQHDEGHVNSEALSRFEHDHTKQELPTEHIEWFESLPSMSVEQRDGHRICLAHAFPWPEQASGYESGNSGVLKRDLVHVASAVSDDHDYVFLGHTHEQYEQDCSKFGHDVHFANPGSLGYEGEYAVFDTETGEIELKEAEYSDEATLARLRQYLPDDAPPASEWW